MAESFRAPIGTQDVLPPESARWQNLIAAFAGVAERFGFGLVHGPLFEDVGVFQRLGVGTEVVRKEMYDFRDKGDRHLALRPDATASVARAYVQHRPPTPWKVWCLTPAWRYERPQAGRLRQHHQVDVEAIGVADPDLDVEVIALGAAYLQALGLRRWRLVLNTMGTPADRAATSSGSRTGCGRSVSLTRSSPGWSGDSTTTHTPCSSSRARPSTPPSPRSSAGAATTDRARSPAGPPPPAPGFAP